MFKFNKLMICIITGMYCFRAIVTKIGFSNLPAYLTIVSIVINLIFIVVHKKRSNKIQIPMFLLVGGFFCFFSILVYGIIVPSIGFIALFINLIYWMVIIFTTSKDNLEKVYFMYTKFILVCGFFNAFIAIYQYYFDCSLHGLTTHKIYGNVEIMQSGAVVKRAIALMGSPQNFSLFTSIAFCLGVMYIKRPLTKTIYLLLVGISGFLSGSRAFSAVIIIFLLCRIIYKLKSGKIGKKTITIIYLIVFLISSFILMGGYSIILNNSTFERLFNLKLEDLVAQSIYLDFIQSMKCIDYLIGKGIGYNERLVAEVLKLDYQSCESYLLSILMQGGILFLLSFLILYWKSIKGYLNSKRTNEAFLLVAIFLNFITTPSFNGLTMSFVIYPLILFSNCKLE